MCTGCRNYCEVRVSAIPLYSSWAKPILCLTTFGESFMGTSMVVLYGTIKFLLHVPETP